MRWKHSEGRSNALRGMRAGALGAALVLGVCTGAGAALDSFGPVSIADGFPVWYQDQNGLRLQLCLDQDTVNPADQTTVIPCLTDEFFPGLPISFPFNFGSEAFWWFAGTAGTYLSSNGFAGQVIFDSALEAGFFNEIPNDGQQVAFGRIRLRIDVPVAGQYRVTHPFGQVTYDIATPGIRAINQTQDVGVAQPSADSFVAALGDGPVPPEPPALVSPRVDDDGPDRSIGPFLTTPGDPASRVLLNGNAYLALPALVDPVTGLEELLTVPVAGGVNDFFEVELVDPAPGFFLDAASASNTVRLEAFTLAGKVFNDGANLAPVAHPDRFGAAPNSSNEILYPLANDVDVRALDPLDPLNPANPANTNVHGLHVQALAVPGAEGLAMEGVTARGGTVFRNVDLLLGQAVFEYTPPPGFTGLDTFTYFTQDTGGLLSNETAVTVAVEDLQVTAAELRTRLLKWTVEGTSSDASLRSALGGAQEVPPVETTATGAATFVRNAEATELAFSLDVAGLSGAVTAAHVHLGAPGENGGVLFTLASADFTVGTGSGGLDGILTAAGLTPQGDVTTFAEALAALYAGRAYVNVHTGLNPAGEIRGQVLPNRITVHAGPDLAGPAVGSAPVGPDGVWSLRGGALAGPGVSGMVSVQSANGVSRTAVPLRVR
ncbi:MAG: CHRD domain-containing protein [Thermodesulfobacteriota bacterium]